MSSMINNRDLATRDDIKKIDTRLTGVEKDVSELKKDVSELRDDVKRLEILHEHMDGKLDAIIEILTPNLENTSLINERLDQHEYRIDTLEKFQRASI